MAFSDYWEDASLENLLNDVALPAHDTLYVALFSSVTDDAGGGTELTVGTAPGYMRAAVGACTVSGTTPTRGGNDVAIEFGAAGTDWPEITHVGVYDASTGGNLIFHGALTAARTVMMGDTAQFSPDALGLALA